MGIEISTDANGKPNEAYFRLYKDFSKIKGIEPTLPDLIAESGSKFNKEILRIYNQVPRIETQKSALCFLMYHLYATELAMSNIEQIQLAGFNAYQPILAKDMPDISTLRAKTGEPKFGGLSLRINEDGPMSSDGTPLTREMFLYSKIYLGWQLDSDKIASQMRYCSKDGPAHIKLKVFKTTEKDKPYGFVSSSNAIKEFANLSQNLSRINEIISTVRGFVPTCHIDTHKCMYAGNGDILGYAYAGTKEGYDAAMASLEASG